MIYRAYTLTLEGNVVDMKTYDCETDDEAVRMARELIGDHAIEVWEGPRRVARLKARSPD
jgi:hypothetical protein